MISKWLPAILTSASLGGSIYYITNFMESEIRVNQIVEGHNNIDANDKDLLRKRNANAFKVDNSGTPSVGSAWKAWTKGKVYKDDTYHVFKDWSWLNKVQIEGNRKVKFSGGEKLKSYVDGVGLKVEKIDETWDSSKSAWKRSIKVKRVLMKDGRQFQIGKGTCLLKATKDNATTSNTNLYLLVGFRRTDNSKYISKLEKEEFIDGHEAFCDRYAKNSYRIGNDKIAISFDVKDGQITGKEYPIIATTTAKNNTMNPIYLKGKDQIPVNAVVLGIAIKGKWKSDSEGWEILNEQQAIKDIQSKIKAGDIVERHSKTETVGFELNKKTELKGETTESWNTTAQIIYK